MSRRAGTERKIGGSTILWDTPPTVVTILDPRNHHEESLPMFAETVHHIITGRNLSKTAIVRNFLPEFRQTVSEFPTSEGIILELKDRSQSEFFAIDNEPQRLRLNVGIREANIFPHFQEHILLHLQSAFHRYNDTYVTDPLKCLHPQRRNSTTVYMMVWNKEASAAYMDTFSRPFTFFPQLQHDCLTVIVALSNDTHLLVYDEYNNRWQEIIFQRGDILLLRGDKTCKDVNHREDNAFLIFHITDYHTAQQLLHSPADLQGGYYNRDVQDLPAVYAQHQANLFGPSRRSPHAQQGKLTSSAAVEQEEQQYSSDHSADKRHNKRKRSKAKAQSQGIASARTSVPHYLHSQPTRYHEWNPNSEQLSSEEDEEEHSYRPNPNFAGSAERKPLPVPREEQPEHPYQANPNLARSAERKPLPAPRPQQLLRLRHPHEEHSTNISDDPSSALPPPSSSSNSQRRSARGVTPADPASEIPLKTNR